MLLYVFLVTCVAYMYLLFVLGSYPSASPKQEFSFVFLRSRVSISFMSMFARFMYVVSFGMFKFFYIFASKIETH